MIVKQLTAAMLARALPSITQPVDVLSLSTCFSCMCSFEDVRRDDGLILIPVLCVCRCPWLSKVISPAVPLYNGLVFLFVLANFSMATFMDPGVYPRGVCACHRYSFLLDPLC